MSLLQIDENIWCLDGDSVTMFTIPFQTRMTIIRQKNDDLWLHSPVAIDESRINAVKKLGRVSHIIAPNSLHHLFVKDWFDRFPDSKIWVAPDLPKKLPNLEFYGILREKPESFWEDEIDQIYFQGSNILPEMIFFHKKSKTLVVTDLIQNHDPSKNNWFWKMVKGLNGILAPNGGVPKDLRLSIRDKKLATESFKKIFEWDFQRIIMSHGICINNNAKEFFINSFDWLDK